MSVPYPTSRWPVAVTTAGLWAFAAASIVFWGLRLMAPSDGAPPPALVAPPVAVDPAAVAQLLGAVPTQPTIVAAPDAASRFVLMGVVADIDQQGAALIAVDGQPARPFRVGATLGGSYVLQSVTTRGASLGASVSSATALSLQLPTQPLAVMGPSR